jgi:hypothetical protein
MSKIHKILLLLIITVHLNACTYFHVNPGWAKSPELDMTPPPGPAIYQQGFKDGCESGYSGYAFSGQKLFWHWKQDPALTENKVYYQIWKDAYAYCANYAMIETEMGLGNWR